MDKNQQVQPAPTPTETPSESNTQQPINEAPTSMSRSRLTLLIITILATIGLGAFYLIPKQNELNQQKARNLSITQASPTPQVNLNPNTGNLYNDISVRLKEVIK